MAETNRNLRVVFDWQRQERLLQIVESAHKLYTRNYKHEELEFPCRMADSDKVNPVEISEVAFIQILK